MYIKKCPHPGCPVPDMPDPWEMSQCTANKPMLLYIPPGQHVHIMCPVHPEGHIFYGSGVTWCSPSWSQPSWFSEPYTTTTCGQAETVKYGIAETWNPSKMTC